MSKHAHRTGEIGDFDPYRMFIANVPLLVSMARSAAMHSAFSYRGFKVGVAAQGHYSETGEISIVSAGNLKPREFEDKICAEYIALQKLDKTGMQEVTGLVVVATTDRKKIAEVNQGLATPTLPPCHECQHGVCTHHKLMRRSSLIVTAGLEATSGIEDIYQAHLNGELLDSFKDHNHGRLFDNVHTFEDWSQRTGLYDQLVVGERAWPGKKQRSNAMLARMALTADLAA